MKRLIILSSFVVLCAHTSYATETQTEPSLPSSATYILKVSSNLSCDSLSIDLISSETSKNVSLTFYDGAFSSVIAAPGAYSFGSATCTDGNQGTQIFETLRETLAPIQLEPRKAYYGGELVFKETLTQKAKSEPIIVDNCTRGADRGPKQSNGECRDGIGSTQKSKEIWTVNFYAPDLKDSEINQVREALSATPEQLIYMPLKAMPD